MPIAPERSSPSVCCLSGEVEVGEEELPRPQARDLLRLRLLDLDDHLGGGEDVAGAAGDPRPGPLIGLVVEADAGAGARLDQHLMPVMHRLAHAARHQPDTVLLRLHFLGHADPHRSTALWSCQA